MHTETKQLIISARQTLHALAELPGQERQTQAFIRDFLRRHSSLEPVDCGTWLYARHDEGAEKTLVVRADHDAVPTPCGPKHLCGHDGHTAALLGLALLLEGRRIGKNVILLFQPAEETGAGAEACCALFAREGLTRDNACVIGCHNIPGQPLGTLLLRRGSFACASCGLEIRLTGSPAHAAYPENGRNPAGAAARLALALPALAAEITAQYGCMALATVVGMRIGERAFGVAASEGQLWVTLRAERADAFRALIERAEAAVRELARAEGLQAAAARYEAFPATENDPALEARMEQLCAKAALPWRLLEHAFRWSEDFGHYGRYLPACFFGVGAGEETPPLHTAAYVWPEALAPRTAELFLALAAGL